MNDYEKAFDIVIGIEGGYVNDPKDPGGETKYGISKRSYPQEDIKNLSLDRARYLYRRDFWDKVRGDSLPWPLNLFLFDFAIHSGLSQAVRTLQRGLGVNADSIVGQDTIRAAQKSSVDRQLRYLVDRVRFLETLPTYPTYANGWLFRILNLATYL